MVSVRSRQAGHVQRPAGSPTESLIGCVLEGVYRLDAVISRGSTAVVYRGTNLRLDLPVAVKVLADYLTDDPALMSRFEAEAKLQAKLQHPYIVSVKDFVNAESVYAIVMEFFEGRTLDQILFDLDGPMDSERIRQLCAPVLDAIGHAHSRGIIHRDIKPSNILVAKVGSEEYPKVMDFGIAKLLVQSSTQTAPGAMLGTLLYMSPEQCKALKTVDERSDIYSLGITLYQMATGMVPFYADSAFDIMMAHVQTPPPPPRELVEGISAPLESVILKALAKDPDERYADAQALKTALLATAQAERESARLKNNREAERPVPTPSAEYAAVRPGRSSLVVKEMRQARESVPSEHRAAADSDTEVVALEDLDLPVPDADGLARVSAEVARSAKPAHLREEPFGKRKRVSGLRNGAQQAAAPMRGPAELHERPAALLRLRVPNRGAWARYFDANAVGGGVFCPTSDPAEVGTEVRLEIVFVGGPRFFVRGAVTWRRLQAKDRRTRAGVGIQVFPTERAKINYVNRWTQGTATDQRRGRRLPVKLPVAYSARAGRRVNFTSDINEQGVFVRSQELLPLGTPIRLLLMPPGGMPPFDLRGRVSRLVERADERGMGIGLEFGTGEVRGRYASFVESLEEKFLRGELGDELIS